MQQLPRDALDEAVPVVDDEARLLVDAGLPVAERLRGDPGAVTSACCCLSRAALSVLLAGSLPAS